MLYSNMIMQLHFHIPSHRRHYTLGCHEELKRTELLLHDSSLELQCIIHYRSSPKSVVPQVHPFLLSCGFLITSTQVHPFQLSCGSKSQVVLCLKYSCSSSTLVPQVHPFLLSCGFLITSTTVPSSSTVTSGP